MFEYPTVEKHLEDKRTVTVSGTNTTSDSLVVMMSLVSQGGTILALNSRTASCSLHLFLGYLFFRVPSTLQSATHRATLYKLNLSFAKLQYASPIRANSHPQPSLAVTLSVLF